MGAAIKTLAKLREQESSPVADVGIVHSKLMAVIPKRQRLGEIIREGLEAAEMRCPFVLGKGAKSDSLSRSPVQESRFALRKIRSIDRVEEAFFKLQNFRVGPVGLLERHSTAIGERVRWGKLHEFVG